MSANEHILVIARTLELQGQEPSVALIKARLSKPMPLPAIIKGLQQYKAMPEDAKARISVTATQVVAPAQQEAEDELTVLRRELAELRLQVQELQARVTDLEGLD
ncbi:hypothetical protein JYB88_05285 [Shewanella cyperi]|uniref:KfrA N-terminal DNA-binding domain-containing protein n=1 Tax=Shewanella cyperi TaxID=2814292 RepID=A0A974XMD2_9GAMM|nr:hypothetical protein [Shewanella cyperi]QSX31056.1 hypothetical protein JYB88_05285 [Shewanella cyperi]